MATISLAIPSTPVNDDGQSSEAEVEEPSLPFHRLPDEIIEQILDYTCPNSFASLLLLNRRWREVADRSYLYARHLSNCPSYSAAHRSNTPPEGEDCLPQLRRLFAHEVKRNLFEAYLRPRETVINLVSTSISSSSAPGGEAFHFSLSSKGHYVLAYSSSRIHVIDVTAPEIVVRRELKIFRRPVATTITDNGSLLAVLSTDLQVDLYDLTGEHPKHTQVVALDHTPRTIALSPTGSILAAAYDSGVEVSSLDPGASIERRSVKCYAVDSLSFSGDSTQLLGTTLQSRNPSTVALTAPYYDPGSSLQEESVSALWTNSLLFPNLSRDCSHAVLLPSHLDDEASWTFTYDRVFETFRAVRIDDLRNGTTYFTGPTAEFGSVSHLLPSTLPAASASGDLVAAGFQGSIWLYGVPEDLDATPNISNGMNSNIESEVGTPVSPIGRRNSAPSLRSINSRPSTSRTPQWQLLCDKVRNTFIEGRKMATLDGVSAMTWVSDISESHGERLVAVAPGVGSQSPVSDDDGMSPTDGGRITILDFKYGTFDGSKRVVTVEVGEKEPQVLEEEHRDMDTEVAIVRRRTVAQRGRGNRIGGGNIGRSPTSAARAVPLPLPAMPALQDLGDPYEPQTSLSSSRRPSQQANLSDGADTVSVDDEEEAFDAPYSQTSPRSGTTLRRAATAAAINRRLHPRAVAQEHIEYRRADGRNEHPHESDADNWVPPPPPYSKDPVPTLPEHLERAVLAEALRNLQQSQRLPATSDPPGLAGLGSLHRTRTTFTPASAESRQRTSLQRTLSDSTTRTTRSSSIDEDVYRPVTSPVTITFDDIYDVSPPGTPQPIRRETSRIQQPIPRRPVGSGAASSTASAPNPAMRATVQQPVSPILPMTTDTPGRRTVSWEDSTGPTGEAVGGEETSSTTSKRLTRDRMDQALPSPPNDEHHLTSPPPTTEGLLDEASNMPKLQASPPQPKRSETAPIPTRAVDTSEEPLLIPKRSDTAPVLTSQSQSGPLSPSLESVGMPSADQMARLNSRTGRPPRNVLANPSQRRSSSGPHAPPQFTVGNGVEQSRRRSVSDPRQRPFAVNNSPVRSGQSPRLTPDQAFRSTPPRAAVGAHGSPARSNNGSRLAPSSSPSHGRYPPSTSPSRRGSQGSISSRQNEPPSPGLRPPMARLETIRSVSSAGEPSPFFNPRPMTLGRTQSRAEKNAARNIKDAKKKGWRASMRKEKSKPKAREAAGNMAWTSDSGQGVDVKGKDDKKCVIM